MLIENSSLLLHSAPGRFCQGFGYAREDLALFSLGYSYRMLCIFMTHTASAIRHYHCYNKIDNLDILVLIAQTGNYVIFHPTKPQCKTSVTSTVLKYDSFNPINYK